MTQFETISFEQERDKILSTIRLAPSPFVPKARKQPPNRLKLVDDEDDHIKTLLLESITYMSHPSLSCLECSINLKRLVSPLFLTKKELQATEGVEQAESTFNIIADKVISMETFNPTQIIKNYKLYSLMFKDVAAIKFLKLLFKDHKNHALYQLYIKWVSGSEWMLN